MRSTTPWSHWSPDEDAIIRVEVAAGPRWIGRAMARLPGRSQAAIQVRASTLRVTLRMRAIEDARPEPAAAPRPDAVLGAPKIPDFLAAMPVFNR